MSVPKKVVLSEWNSKPLFTLNDLEEIYQHIGSERQSIFQNQNNKNQSSEQIEKNVQSNTQEYVRKKFGEEAVKFYNFLYENIEYLVQVAYYYREKLRYDKDLLAFLGKYYPKQEKEILEYFGGFVYLRSLDDVPKEKWDSIQVAGDDQRSQMSLTEYYKIIESRRALRDQTENAVSALHTSDITTPLLKDEKPAQNKR